MSAHCRWSMYAGRQGAANELRWSYIRTWNKHVSIHIGILAIPMIIPPPFKRYHLITSTEWSMKFKWISLIDDTT